ncbi:hypothetical protein HG263_04190 [Pseudoalteromonas sp. JBTF-M23]|uniref:Uncharacterized protein n=1 Tax=Pseudoalteromonas caenipelagi TaxID=2726988 RepID=A0A849VCR6_9GAMM|nr:hypothetical protein [Pseudoalteromonas caenipelagi]NOU49734.1 hypothetical protein [Pseudoalteromonas caenipelagi]
MIFSAIVLGYVGYKICLQQCRKSTPSSGTILITESDNYIEFQGALYLVGKVSSAQLFINILCLQVTDYSGARQRVLIGQWALSAQDWSHLCRVCFAHDTIRT